MPADHWARYWIRGKKEERNRVILQVRNSAHSNVKTPQMSPCGNHCILSFVYNFNQNDILTSRMIPEVDQTRATKPQFDKNWGWNEKSRSGKSAQGEKNKFLVLWGDSPLVLDLRYLWLDCCCSYSSLNQALLEYDCTNPLNW